MGTKHEGHDEKRRLILRCMVATVFAAPANQPSFRQFAAAAGVSEPTLRHYFKDRDGCVAAILEYFGVNGQSVWRKLSEAASSPGDAVSETFGISRTGMMTGGFIQAHTFGVVESAGNPRLADVYRRKLLDPAVQAIADKILATPGMTNDPREASAVAWAIFSPLLVLGLRRHFLSDANTTDDETDGYFESIERMMAALLERARQSVLPD